jgi:prepilin-type processing-associated H-X9-DG protein/prepilin-type N-terminal cleavage/methylation domain-containing protein
MEFRRPLRIRGFTLVELLVVVGIVVVLIALLLPALARAREAANRTRCLATLRSMAQAAHLHAADHKGYMPVAGPQGPPQAGIRATPEALRDAARVKYMYWDDLSGVSARPIPLPAALGYYLGRGPLRPGAGSRESISEASMASPLLRELFACPSQDWDSTPPGYVLGEMVERIGPRVYMSYIFNGTALGLHVFPWGETPAGNVSRMRRPGQVMLFADGLPSRITGGDGHLWALAQYSTDETMAEFAWSGGRYQLDFARHNGWVNVVFVDGHAEPLLLPDPRRWTDADRDKSDLVRAGLSKGIFN